ncbi:MAG: phosphate acyltransferase [Opitutaceae bacterium]|nr:phosphate acyltransferase [Opitutaceae bacterium]
MSIVQNIVAKLQRHPKRIVFPEGGEARVIQAARQFVALRMGVPVLLGNRVQIKDTAQRLDISLQGIRVLDPERSDEMEGFVSKLAEMKRDTGMSEAGARAALRDPNCFAAMMLLDAQAEALVSGTTMPIAGVLRPLLQYIPMQENVLTASSMTIIDFDEKKVGIGGSLFFADCGVIPEPTAEQLCDIALTTANVAHHLTGELPRVAMLSFASHNESGHPSVSRMRHAAELARVKALSLGIVMEIDGELQVDSALDLLSAEQKRITSEVAGRANVLIFPDLNSGNIGYKLVHILAGAYAYGQVITGLSRPAVAVSRGASAHDILGAAAIVGCQAIDRRLLYGTP